MSATDLQMVYRAMNAGTAALRRRAELLDRINVFPVMDGDTGTNMSVTLNALPMLSEGDAPPTVEQTTAELLRAACGNSGIILAEFIAGFLASLKKPDGITFSEFAHAVKCGRDRAYEAVLSPKEGTMLTVMSVAADALSSHDRPFDGTAHTLLCEKLLVSVHHTRETIEKLKNAGVVDSGALGFYLFVSGLTLAAVATADPALCRNRTASLYEGKEDPSSGELDTASISLDKSQEGPDEKHFCINILIHLREGADPLKAFDGLGDSANFAREGNLLKLHLHADEVDAVKSRALSVGEILDLKVQDMHAAMRTRTTSPDEASGVRKRIRVMTDSGVSLDREIASRLGILRVDNSVVLFDKKVPDREVDLDELLLAMRAGKSFKTAQVTPDDAAEFLRVALNISDHVIYIGVGNAYTGTQTSVRTAGRAFASERLTLLDSKAASGQLGLICLAVQRFADTGATLADVIVFANDQIATCKEYLMIDDLEYLARSGRIGRIKAGFAALLSMKPIVGHGGDGAITHAKVRSLAAAEKEIGKRIDAHPGQGPLLIMVEYTDNRPYVETLRDKLAARLPENTEIVLSPLSSASAVHMGPGTFGVAVTRMRP